MNSEEANYFSGQRKHLDGWVNAWASLYAGSLVVDDIEALAQQIDKQGGRRGRLSGSEPFPLDTRKGQGDLLSDLLV